jgi:hypothetical protein
MPYHGRAQIDDLGFKAMTLIEMLHELSKRDLGDLPNFVAGRWSRENLEALIQDLEWELDERRSVTRD